MKITPSQMTATAGEKEQAMSERKKVLVCGSGRCGLTAMMTALDSGGFAVVGQCPDYEDERAIRSIERMPADMAIKVLDPAASCLEPGAFKAIYLTRNTKQQAKSQIRLLVAAGFMKAPSPFEAKDLEGKMSKRITKDDSANLAWLTAKRANPILCLSFERLLKEPREVMEEVAAFLDVPHFDYKRAAAAIHVRDAKLRETMWEPESDLRVTSMVLEAEARRA